MWNLDPADTTAPARGAAAFVDEVVKRARHLTPLVEFFRAHLDAGSPRGSCTVAEHVVDLLSLGLRWRAHARGALRRPTARPDHDAVAALLLRLRGGRPPAELARLDAWNEFAVEECCPEALDEACELATWFELAADAALGRSAPGLEAQLELVRAEVLSRSLRERRLRAFARDPLPSPGLPSRAPGAPVARLRLRAPPAPPGAGVPRPAVARAGRLW
jgi:hypothetical protein